MIFPSLSQYLSIMLFSRGRFATLGKVAAVVDDGGEPIFKSHRHSVLFLADVDGERCSLRFFTHNVGYSGSGRLLHNELILDSGARLDIVVENAFACQHIEQKSDKTYYEGRAVVEIDGKFGFVDVDNKIVISAQYDSAEIFSEGRSVVELDGLWGLIDLNGNHIIAPLWDDLSYDGSTLCYVERNGLCGVIDRMGRVISEPIWDWMGEYSGGMLLVERDKKYGFLDLDGNVAIDIIYDDATSFDANKYATVTLGSRQYQIDTQQNRV